MDAAVLHLPDDVEALKALLVSTIRRADEAEARLVNATARESATQAMIASTSRVTPFMGSFARLRGRHDQETRIRRIKR